VRQLAADTEKVKRLAGWKSGYVQGRSSQASSDSRAEDLRCWRLVRTRPNQAAWVDL
jgi:hypothetical protein